MNMSEIRQLDTKKLWKELRSARRALAVSRFQVKTGSSTNTGKIRTLRKTIARILTHLTALKTAS